MSTRRRFNSRALNPRIPNNIKAQKTPKRVTLDKPIKTLKKYKNHVAPARIRYKPINSLNNVIVESGVPTDTVANPINGQLYVNKDSGDTYLFAASLGWIDMSGWQPDVGEGVPDATNPPNPLSGDQYLNILNGDLFVFNEGLGWVMLNGVEGPPGPPGESFSFDLETYQDGVEGPMLSGPLKVEAGKCVKLWIKNGQIYSDVV